MNESKKRWEDLKEGDLIYKISDFGVVSFKIKRIEDGQGYRDTIWRKIILETGKQIIYREGSKTKNYFILKEEAEEAIEYKKKVAKKMQLMYEYESKINEEIGLNSFLIKY